MGGNGVAEPKDLLVGRVGGFNGVASPEGLLYTSYPSGGSPEKTSSSSQTRTYERILNLSGYMTESTLCDRLNRCGIALVLLLRLRTEVCRVMSGFRIFCSIILKC